MMSIRSLGSIVAFAITSVGYRAAAQAPASSVQTVLLESRATNPITTPLFSSRASKCDAHGDVFFDLAGSMYSVKLILRVPRSGGDPTPILLPTDLGSAGEWALAVDEGGMVYALFSEAEKHVLITFTASGKEGKRTNLQLPRYFQTHSFAINREGNGMFFGAAQVIEDATAPRYRPQTIWLNQDGAVVRVSAPGESFDLSIEQPDGQIVEGPANTFLRVSRSELTSFDDKGNVIRASPVPQAPNGSSVSYMQYIDGHVAIQFSYPAEPSPGSAEDTQSNQKGYLVPLTQTWLLMNPDNGEAEGFFHMPSHFLGSALCYTGSHRFVYLSVLNGQPTLIEAL